MRTSGTSFGTSATGDDPSLPRRFWRKFGGVAAHIPFAEDLLAAYYCAFDRATPLQVKGTLLGAIAYFVVPLDVMPDVMPLLGFTDDAAVIAAVLATLGAHLKPRHHEQAAQALRRLREDEE